jgi:hypothetical protein
MEDDALFYILTSIFIIVVAFLYIAQIGKIKNIELEKNRQLFNHRTNKENKQNIKISYEKERKERHKAIVLKNFRVERFWHNMPLQQVNGIVKVNSKSEENSILSDVSAYRTDLWV